MTRNAILIVIATLGILSNLTPILSGEKLVPAKPISIKEVIAQQEAQKGIPKNLLRAIAKIESGLAPWAVNARGRAYIFKTKEAAASYVRELVDEGTRNFSVGCMQLHYASHRHHFKSVEAMLEPQNNIAHAAKLIKKLALRHGSMERAVKFYHSPSPNFHNRYRNRVYGVWAKIQKPEPTNGEVYKPVSLQNRGTKARMSTRQKRPPKIKFGVGAPSSNIAS